MSRKLALVLALAVLLVPAVALAANGHGNGQPGPDQILRSPKLLAKYLHLTPDQVTQEQQFFKTLGTTLKALRDQGKTLHDQLAALLGGSNPNACDVGAIVVQIDALHSQAKAAFDKFDQDFSAILTPDQLTKYEALKEAAHIGDDPTP